MKTRGYKTIFEGWRMLGSRRARREFAATVVFACVGNAVVLAAILYLNDRLLS